MVKGLIKSLLGWHRRSEAEQRELQRRVAVLAYQARVVLATLICWLPIPLPMLLHWSGSDKHKPDGHRYGPAYASCFSRFRYRRIKLLEIGVGGFGWALGGESLNAWRAYFPLGRLVACDIEDKPGIASRGTRIYRIDQSSEADLAMLREREGPFDIIIDDGSHLSRHQLFTFHRLFDSLKDGGLYVIEDVMTSLWSFRPWDGGHIDTPEFAASCVGYFLALAPYLQADEFDAARAVNPDLVQLAARIRSIQFHKNLIVIERLRGSKGATYVQKLRALTAEAA